VITLPNWITVKAASGKLGIAERTVRHWIHKGKLTAKKDGRLWVIDGDAIDTIINGNIADSGNDIAESTATAARETTIAVPLERYEALITRLAQLEIENQEYRHMLEEHRHSWWHRLRRRINPSREG
jgi:excisionase family DNA binding protein